MGGYDCHRPGLFVVLQTLSQRIDLTLVTRVFSFLHGYLHIHTHDCVCMYKHINIYISKLT